MDQKVMEQSNFTMFVLANLFLWWRLFRAQIWDSEEATREEAHLWYDWGWGERCPCFKESRYRYCCRWCNGCCKKCIRYCVNWTWVECYYQCGSDKPSYIPEDEELHRKKYLLYSHILDIVRFLHSLYTYYYELYASIVCRFMLCLSPFVLW